MSNTSKTSLHCRIISVEGIIYDQDVAALSSINETGAFDILPFHANFISIIKQKIIVRQLDSTIKEFPFEIAVLKAFNNEAKVFLGIESVELAKEDAAPA